MNNLDKIITFANKNGGIVTTPDVAKLGITISSLPYLAENERLRQVSRGIYVLPHIWEDDFFVLQKRYQRGIYSRNTALYLHNLVDQTPHRFHMAFPKNYYAKSLKQQPIIVDRLPDTIYSLGIEEIATPMGNQVSVYNIEKTLCEILMPANNTDIQIITSAFKEYASRTNKDINQLFSYASQLSVEKTVRKYMEVLL